MQHTTHSPATYDAEVLRAWAEQAINWKLACEAISCYLEGHLCEGPTSEYERESD
ncbi:MAG: hypothetical protein ACXIU5_07500 [Halomonadaceae bacterium]|jgi:hypothetical protein